MQLLDHLIIHVEFSTEDEVYGPVYVATHDGLGLVTDRQTFEALLSNLHEALSLYLEDDHVRGLFNLAPHPKIELRMTVPETYAQAT